MERTCGLMKSILFLTVLLTVVLGLGLSGPGNARAQSASRRPSREDGRTAPAVSVPTPGGGGQSLLFGGVPSGTATAEVLPLSLSDAIDRGLKHNLGQLLGEQSVRAARGARWRALSDLLPNVATSTTETRKQVNLTAFGFSGFPGTASIVGPFNVFDTRVFLSQPVLDFNALNKARAEADNLKAAEYSYKNTRDLVVLVCGNLYWQASAGRSRIEAARAQLNTARALYTLAVDQKNAGMVAGIDVLRAQVELQAQQQRLIVADNEFAKQKLALARAIGLPLGQEFSLTDQISYAPLSAMTLDDALQRAYRDRGDYRSAIARVRAAESARKAAVGEGLPSVDIDADYGDIGSRPGRSHGTFAVAANVRIPIFQGGRVHGNVLEADAVLEQAKAELEDSRARIYYEIRSAFLDLTAADDRVQVAKSAVDLANEQVKQAQDRFAAGVASNIEVVQAQAALAAASESYISSLYAHNVAKGTLAQVLGVAEDAYKMFLRGK